MPSGSVSADEAMRRLTDKGPAAPPNSPIDAREIVLICLLTDFENSKWVLEDLDADHFGLAVGYSGLRSPGRKIFDIIVAVEKSGQRVGIPAVLDRWPKEDSYSRESVSERFDRWRAELEKGVDLHSAVDVLKRQYKIIQLQKALQAGIKALDDTTKDPNVVAANTASVLDGLTTTIAVPTVSQEDLNRETFESLTAPSIPIYSTGFEQLDRRIGGLSPSRSYVVAARTGGGKTAFLLNLACNLGRQNVPLGFISLEMNREAMNKRLWSITGRLESSQFKSPIPSAVMERIKNTIAETNQWKFYWSDKRGLSISDLRSKLSQLARLGCRVVFVDYIQRVSVESKEPRHLQVAQIAKTLADLAEKLSIAIVAASQTNREGAKSNKTPDLHNLSESTVIEESADVVLMLRNKTKEDETKGLNRPVEMNVAKNRHGFGGVFDMYYRGREFRFSDQPFMDIPVVKPLLPRTEPVPPPNLENPMIVEVPSI